MSNNNQFTISEFSRLTGIKPDNLRFYDRIHLLSPEFRGENKYRYYSRHQLNTAYFITGLRILGVGIEEIKEYSVLRTPKTSLELLSKQEARIQKEIQQLMETQLIMHMHSEMISEALKHQELIPFIEEREEEAIFLCPALASHMDDDEGSVFSYNYAEEMGVNLGFPQGTLMEYAPEDPIRLPSVGSYYFKQASKANAYKPAGLYAIVYGIGDPWDSTMPLYHKLITFIQEQGYELCGKAYEEYPLNDISVQSVDQYGIRIEVLIRKKER